MEWLDQLIDEVTDKISEVSKFKTHKHRKAFYGEIADIIKSTVLANIKIDNTRSALGITRPNPNKSLGYKVMTAGESMQGDKNSPIQ